MNFNEFKWSPSPFEQSTLSHLLFPNHTSEYLGVRNSKGNERIRNTQNMKWNHIILSFKMIMSANQLMCKTEWCWRQIPLSFIYKRTATYYLSNKKQNKQWNLCTSKMEGLCLWNNYAGFISFEFAWRQETQSQFRGGTSFLNESLSQLCRLDFFLQF